MRAPATPSLYFFHGLSLHRRYVGDGLFEPTWIRQFYQQFIYPKLQPHQRVWVVPGLTGPLQDGVAPPGPPYLNDTLFLEKIQVQTTAQFNQRSSPLLAAYGC
jgi:hypothetical protein